jgi:2,4-dienoyl-CoA reductase-like NADH-dependent reductase (Old Yellow Enzyme family)
MAGAPSAPGLAPLKDSVLFKPLKLGRLELDHRVCQAPLTRMRARKESDGVFVPYDLNVEYYKQRANRGGFQLTEATDICHYVCSWATGCRFIH